MWPLRLDLRGQQMAAPTARAMTLSASVGNGRITETATRVLPSRPLALSSRTPALMFRFRIRPNVLLIQSAVMPIFRIDPYGNKNGAFFECCQQNKNKYDKEGINKPALCAEQCLVLTFSGTGK